MTTAHHAVRYRHSGSCETDHPRAAREGGREGGREGVREGGREGERVGRPVHLRALGGARPAAQARRCPPVRGQGAVSDAIVMPRSRPVPPELRLGVESPLGRGSDHATVTRVGPALARRKAVAIDAGQSPWPIGGGGEGRLPPSTAPGFSWSASQSDSESQVTLAGPGRLNRRTASSGWARLRNAGRSAPAGC